MKYHLGEPQTWTYFERVVARAFGGESRVPLCPDAGLDDIDCSSEGLDLHIPPPF